MANYSFLRTVGRPSLVNTGVYLVNNDVSTPINNELNGLGT